MRGRHGCRYLARADMRYRLQMWTGVLMQEEMHSIAVQSQLRTAIWVALVTGSSLLFSLALACATPFAALAAISGAKMPWRGALALIGCAWLANQAVGYLLLDYPQSWDSFAWGAAIGVAAGLALVAAFAIRSWTRPGLAEIVGGFIAAFCIYEGVLFAATAFLPSGEEVFSPAVVAEIFWINVLALAGLLALHRIAVAAGLLVPETGRRHAAGYA
jgi:hypothetical protein